MSGLPPRLASLVEHVIARSGLDEAGSREVRVDLTQHLRDGLARGRSVDELVRRFGDPAVTGPLLARSPAPRSGVLVGGVGDGMVASLLGDIRHAVRGLLKAPSLSVTATIVLALGVGANTVVFTVLNELLLRPLPVEDPSMLVDIWADVPGGNSFLGFAYQDVLTYQDDNSVLEGLVAFTGQRLELGESDDALQVTSQFVSPGYFEMLGLTPTIGVLSFDRDARFGDAPVTVVSHGFWTESFGGDPTLVGRTIRLQDRQVTVVGVGPPGFTGHFIGFRFDFWLPITAADQLLASFDPDDRSKKPLELLGRLRPGVTVETARSALNSLAEEIERQYPEINRGHRVGVTPTTGLDHSLQAGVTAFVMILTTVSALVLLIACLNVGSVLLVRAMARDRELAVRIALGAGRARLLRQLLTESTVLVTLGALVGVVVAVRLNAGLADTLRVLSSGISLDLHVDWRVLGLTAVAALTASALASIAPALHVFQKDPAGVLCARGSASRAGTRLRAGLVVGQVSVSVVLVIATGLFVRALVAGGQVDPGFDADQVATFTLTLPDGEPGALAELQRDIVDAIGALPTVDAVAVAGGPPLGVARSPMAIDVPGVLPPPDSDRHVVDVRSVGAGYLAVVGIPLRSGRDFTDADDRGGPMVAIVSEAFAQRFWPEGQTLGRTFTVGVREVQVVGVAEDTRFIVQDDSPDPLVYLSRAGRSDLRTLVTLRGSSPLSTSEAVRDIVSTRIPGHRVLQLRTGRDILDASLLPQRLGSIIVGAMGLVALFLAAVGLYGLVHFTVARDTPELGVRLALGSSRRDLVLVVLGKGFRLVAIGIAVGVGIALLIAPRLSGFLAGVSPADPFTYVTVVASFAAVSLFASWLPARRALRIDPTEALRGD